MNANALLQVIGTHGVWIVFLLAFVEYLNIPGYPGGLAVPAVGVLAASGHMNLLLGFLSVSLAGLVGSALVYLVASRFSGFTERLIDAHPSLHKSFDRSNDWIEKYGKNGLLLARLVPVVRTFISIPAGLFKMDFISYLFYSFLGNLLYCAYMIALGYCTGSVFFGA